MIVWSLPWAGDRSGKFCITIDIEIVIEEGGGKKQSIETLNTPVSVSNLARIGSPSHRERPAWFLGTMCSIGQGFDRAIKSTCGTQLCLDTMPGLH